MKKLLNYLLSLRRHFSTRLNYTRTVDINGISVCIPSINGMEASITEPWMLEILIRLLQRIEGAFIDVGINTGQTLLKVKSQNPGRTYIGFEPNPACFYYVRELIRQNCFDNCSIIPVGLYIQDQLISLNFYSDDPTDSRASIISDFRSSKQIIHKEFVPVFRFDTVSDALDFDGVGIVKIDVEGAELEVIQSLLGLIRAHRPVILIEVLPVYHAGNVKRLERQEALEAIFLELNYITYRIEKEKNCLAGLTRIESIGIHSDLDRCDYLVTSRDFELQFVAADEQVPRA